MSTSSSGEELRLALVAQDAKKDELIEWVRSQSHVLNASSIFATGTTGSGILEAFPCLDVTCLRSGPLGGALLHENRIGGRWRLPLGFPWLGEGRKRRKALKYMEAG